MIANVNKCYRRVINKCGTDYQVPDMAGLEIRGGHASWPPQWPPPDSPTVAKNGHRNWAKSG